jgi:hypothetical protein
VHEDVERQSEPCVEEVPVPFAASNGKSLRGLKAGLSLFIAFQLMVMVLGPNGRNHLGEQLAPIVNPYLAFFELTQQWSFFAPEPGPPPVFIEYALLDAQGDELHKGRFPDMEHQPFLRERLNRRIAATEYMILDEVRTERIMLPYLCRKFPDAKSVRLWRLSYTIPSMAEVVGGKRLIGDEVDLDRHEISTSFCVGRA